MFHRIDADRASDTDNALLTALTVTVHGCKSKKYLFPIKFQPL